MTTTETPRPDLAVVKHRQQPCGPAATSASSLPDPHRRRAPRGQRRPRAGSRVLDVAGGTGNAAIAAARCGCDVTCTDYVPALLERGRARARAERLNIEFAEADAEALPFEDGEYDAVLSVFGAMFAPDQPRAASELVRVARPGGIIALASWTPDGFLGELFRATAAHVPPPASVPSPLFWGTEERVRELLGGAVSKLELTRRTFVFRFRSPDDFAQFFRANSRPGSQGLAGLGTSRDADASTMTWRRSPPSTTAPRDHRWRCPRSTWKPSRSAHGRHRGWPLTVSG